MTRFGVFAVAVLLGSATPAQVPTPDLAKPPASARQFTILSIAGPHGESWMWTTPDGMRMSRESLYLRGQVFELDAAGTAGADGMPSRLTVRGVTPAGDAAEAFAIQNGQAGWKSPVDAGSAAYTTPASTCRSADRSTCRRGSSSGCSWRRIRHSIFCPAARHVLKS